MNHSCRDPVPVLQCIVPMVKRRSAIDSGKWFSRGRIIFMAALIISAVAVWQVYKYRIVHSKVNKMVDGKSNGLYHIHYDDLVIDEVSGTLHVKNIEVVPDTAVYNQLMRNKTNPSVIFKINIPSLDILRVKTPKALLQKQIEGARVEISSPKIEMMLGQNSNEPEGLNAGKDVYKEILGKLLDIKIDSVHVSHADLTVKDMRTNAVVFRGQDVSLLLSDLLIDSLAGNDSTRILFSKNADLDCDKLELPSNNKKYQLQVEKVRFRSQTNSFYIGRIHLIPQLSEEEFARESVTQKDRYDFMFEEIGLENISREQLWHLKIKAAKLVVGKSSFKIFRDLSYPRDTLSRVGKYPHQQLIRLPLPVLIHEVVFEHSFIEYKEKNAKSDSSGKVQFYDVHASFSHVTNMPAEISKNNNCILLFNAKFLNEAPIHARLVMVLGSPQGRFSIQGGMGAMRALSLNQLTQPMGLARLEKGSIQQLQFNFAGTDSSSDGRLSILYNDLHLSLLKKNAKENKYEKKFLPSLAVNLIAKNSNPSAGGKPRTAHIHYQRNLNKSFFNLVWKSIFTGVKQVAGIK